MSSQAQIVTFTYEDYVLFRDDGNRHELIDGDHSMTPAPSTTHQRVSMNLSNLLKNYLIQHPIGTVFAAPCDVVLSNIDVVQPDLLFVSAARTSIITERNIQGPPDLVIEILSETTRKTDEIVKRKLFERYGVSEYWIVYPELEIVKVYRPTDQGYARVEELAQEAEGRLSTPLLPCLDIPLSAIFE